MDESKLIIFTVSITGLHLYGAFLPPVSEVAINYQTPDEKAVLREAEFIGTAFLLATAGITAYAAKSALPLVLTALIATAMFATYEYALARVAKDKAVT